MSYTRTPGAVGKIRELDRGVEARVTVGSSHKYGTAELVVVGKSTRVMKALDELRAALRAEAFAMLSEAQRERAQWEAQQPRSDVEATGAAAISAGLDDVRERVEA